MKKRKGWKTREKIFDGTVLTERPKRDPRPPEGASGVPLKMATEKNGKKAIFQPQGSNEGSTWGDH